jgi:hypothetical protein
MECKLDNITVNYEVRGEVTPILFPDPDAPSSRPEALIQNPALVAKAASIDPRAGDVMKNQPSLHHSSFLELLLLFLAAHFQQLLTTQPHSPCTPDRPHSCPSPLLSFLSSAG